MKVDCLNKSVGMHCNLLEIIKVLGNNGLSNEVNVCFFHEVNAYLIDSLSHSFRKGQLSTSERQAMITLTEKKGKDK